MRATDERRRPGPLRWLWYAFGGGLPARHRVWVLHDLSTRGWAVRHIGRALVQVSPVVVVLLVAIPAPIAVRAAAVVAGVLLGLLYSCAYMEEISEHRAAKAGYPVGAARAAREDRNAGRRAADRERYLRTWRPEKLTGALRPEPPGPSRPD